MGRNLFKQGWHFLSRLNVAAVLMLVVLVLAVLGSCFPQLEPAVSTDWESNLQARYGPLAGLLAVVGIFDWFSSPVFLISVILLLLATLVCTLDRWQAVYRRATHTPVDVTNIPFDSASFTVTLSISPPGSTATDTVVESLKAKGFRVQSEIVENVIYLRADRNRLARLATLVTHLAVLLLFLGAGLSWGFAWQEEVTIGPGQVVQVEHADQVALRNERFTIARHRDGNAANYEARVSILNRDQAVKPGIIKLNQPLTYQGMNIYLRGYAGNGGHHDITLLVGRDPGYGLVIAAGFLLLLGIVVTLYFPSARIYARLEPPGILHLAGWAERRAGDFEREFSALVERIKYSSIAETERTS